ncbi:MULTISPECIES: phosphotransferase family protein [unclassified Nocardioides]|uniref:phosphotransferase family protein n=1 Tax=unclassified Nocardioides TaxID=2615069 RepID=UPI001F3A9F66|nr:MULTISPECIES: phosphotransferase [unclassified Nocardioides]
MIPNRIPHGRTARRLDWVHLPPYIRSTVERHVGSAVVEDVSQGGGFTPGFASVLTCADGSKHFVKAASTKAQRMFAESYREETHKLRFLPREVPAPRLLWAEDDGEWVLLSTEYVDGRAPVRPWTAEDLAAASAMAVTMAEVLTPAPGEGLTSAAEEFGDWPALWDQIDHPRAADLKALADRYREVVGGSTLVHTDIRDDNILILSDGSAVLCDWNWPVIGAAWIDSLFLLIGPRGDGLDVEAHIAAHPLLSAVPAGDIDVVLALVLAYFTVSAAQPVPSTSPYIRQAQAWQRTVIDDWLAERRGWRD